MSDKKLIEDIEEYGWHIINVFADDNHPQFSYTVGLYKTFKVPELFISGLKGEVASTSLNIMGDEVANGFMIANGREYNDFFHGYNCYFQLVEKHNYNKFFGRAVWFYQGNDFPILQCVWPNKERQYPWQTEMSFNQQVLFDIKK